MRKSNLMISLAVTAALAAPMAHADAGDTTIGGTMFVDFTSISTTQDAPVIPAGAKAPSMTGDIDPNGFGIDVKRAYLIVNHQFDDIWSANLTTDFNLPKYTLNGTGSGTDTTTTTPVTTTDTVSGNAPETQLYVKKAYLQGKFDDYAVLRIGSSDMPWIPYVEGVYGYRFVENTLIDRSIAGGFGSYGNSADWGVNLNGGGSMVSYSISAVNGGGYKNPSRSKGMDFEGRVAVTPIDGLILAGGFYTGKRDLDTEKTPAVNTASRLDFLAAWKASGLTVGVEWFSADKWNDVLNLGTTTKSNGTSIFASYDFPGTDFSVFGRDDSINPTKDTFSDVKDQYYNLGFAWMENKNLTWAVAYKSDKVTDNLKYNLTSDDLKTSELGVWAQIKF